MVSRKQKAVSAAARTGGSFLGGITNNPGIVIIALVLGGLFLFRDQIAKGIGGLGENLLGGLGNIDIKLPDIKFPDFSFPDFSFPEIKFPDFSFPDFEFPDFTSQFQGFQEQFTNLFTGFQEQFDKFEFPVIPPLFKDEDDDTTTSGGGFGDDPRRPPPPVRPGLSGFEIANLPDIADDIEGLTPAQSFAFIERGVIPTGFEVVDGILQNIMQQVQPVVQPFVQPQPVPSTLPSGFELFVTPGSNVPGGAIFETPIANLSLSQIIDKFMVTASQAANILAIAKDDFGDFDFGTNTGLGIGSFVPSGLGGNVSDPNFQGLTAQEIANLLTGGNIQNF